MDLRRCNVPGFVLLYCNEPDVERIHWYRRIEVADLRLVLLVPRCEEDKPYPDRHPRGTLLDRVEFRPGVKPRWCRSCLGILPVRRRV
ncbi:hypothetical protein ACFWY9_16220 [Amycolatopsis sp. NPDC059027]|uniref:hypothetical protein n=1 Tax=unclassified Amycolatopsis TaxID=2618356 RepID=UPI00366CBEED